MLTVFELFKIILLMLILKNSLFLNICYIRKYSLKNNRQKGAFPTI